MECTKNSNTTKSESISDPAVTEDASCRASADRTTDDIWCPSPASAAVTAAGTDFSRFHYSVIADAATAFVAAAPAESWIITASCSDSFTATTCSKVGSTIQIFGTERPSGSSV